MDILISKISSNKKLFISLITLIFVINAISKYSYLIGISLALIEIFILLILFINNNFENYILCFILFFSSSIEVSQFATGSESLKVYNFMNLPIIKGYHTFLFSMLPLFIILREKKITLFFREIRNFKRINIFYKNMIKLTFIGSFSGAICLLLNDNGIMYSPIYWTILRREVLSFGMIFLWTFYISYLLTLRQCFSKKLELWILCILISIIPSAVITVLFNLHGYYGDLEILLLPLVSFYGVLLTIFPYYQDYKKDKSLFISGLLLFFIILLYPSPLSGKWWIVAIFIPIIILIAYFKRLTVLKLFTLYLLMTLITILLVGINFFNLDLGYSFNNKLIETKFLQATRTLLFWKEGWFEYLPSSPKFRIDEFINILYEYIKKPQYLLFGKGFGGSIVHHSNYLDWSMPGAFSQEQVQEGIFISLHETINVLFLKFGLFGLYFFIRIITICVRGIGNNPWIVIGAAWFFFFFNAYISLVLGLCSLILGFYYKDIKNMQLS